VYAMPRISPPLLGGAGIPACHRDRYSGTDSAAMSPDESRGGVPPREAGKNACPTIPPPLDSALAASRRYQAVMSKVPTPYELAVAVLFGVIAGTLAHLVQRLLPTAPGGLVGYCFAGTAGAILGMWIGLRRRRCCRCGCGVSFFTGLGTLRHAL
jgi:uncharacterized membrane protein YeaQ/YmgE (transglycosylase-associated protein family)